MNVMASPEYKWPKWNVLKLFFQASPPAWGSLVSWMLTSGNLRRTWSHSRGCTFSCPDLHLLPPEAASSTGHWLSQSWLNRFGLQWTIFSKINTCKSGWSFIVFVLVMSVNVECNILSSGSGTFDSTVASNTRGSVIGNFYWTIIYC